MDKPVVAGGGNDSSKRNEIFVDIFERINVTLNANVRMRKEREKAKG